jgi:hypothetical protein
LEDLMTGIPIEIVIDQLSAVLREALEGPRERWSYFTDTGAGAGLLSTLSRLSAAEASQVLGETSVAAHVAHVVFGLEASARWIEGDRTTRNWKESWSVTVVDDESWARLRDRVHRGYVELQAAITRYAATSPEAMGGALGALAHAAYHLGAIRQKVTFARHL